MKISKILNENLYAGKIAYLIFKTFHFAKKMLSKKEEFMLLGDQTPKLYVPFHPIPESNLFGHSEILKSYINNKFDLVDLHIQHGVILGDLVQDIMKNSFASTIITYSKKRQEKLAKVTGKKVIAIGPYIRYAKNRLSKNEFTEMKSKYGKTLLVFPAHSSVDRTKISFNQMQLINKINKIKDKHNVKTVFINLFYSDCDSESITYYRSHGFEVCSAGFWLSENFVHNLKTIIELSDITMSNRMGTHIGYCLALNKPHYVYKQEHNEQFVGSRSSEDKIQTDKYKYLTNIESVKIESLFLNDDFVITKDQIDIVNEFWGNEIFYDDKTLTKVLLK
jgi:hypothetical protein